MAKKWLPHMFFFIVIKTVFGQVRCPDDWDPLSTNGLCIRLQLAAQFGTAEMQCNIYCVNCHLISIHNESVNKELAEDARSEPLWIGLSDPDGIGNYSWIDHSELHYGPNWCTGFPINTTYNKCVALYGGDNNGCWQNDDCSEYKLSVCGQNVSDGDATMPSQTSNTSFAMFQLAEQSTVSLPSMNAPFVQCVREIPPDSSCSNCRLVTVTDGPDSPYYVFRLEHEVLSLFAQYDYRDMGISSPEYMYPACILDVAPNDTAHFVACYSSRISRYCTAFNSLYYPCGLDGIYRPTEGDTYEMTCVETAVFAGLTAYIAYGLRDDPTAETWKLKFLTSKFLAAVTGDELENARIFSTAVHYNMTWYAILNHASTYIILSNFGTRADSFTIESAEWQNQDIISACMYSTVEFSTSTVQLALIHDQSMTIIQSSNISQRYQVQQITFPSNMTIKYAYFIDDSHLSITAQEGSKFHILTYKAENLTLMKTDPDSINSTVDYSKNTNHYYYYYVAFFICLTAVLMLLTVYIKWRWQKRRSRRSRLLSISCVKYDLNEILGSGSSSTVYRGLLKRSFSKACDVAIKVPSSSITEELLRHKLEIIHLIDAHPNVVYFFGVLCSKETNTYKFVFELAQDNLLNYARSMKVESFNLISALSLCKDVVSGMTHLTTLGIIHRDLAARNVLLTSKMRAKISDFGLCCRVDAESNAYFQEEAQGRLPLKWLAIEALEHGLFSEKSDIWSFGVLLYELFSLGKIPYANFKADEILPYLLDGKREERPELANDSVYDLMASCWLVDPSERPSFALLNSLHLNDYRYANVYRTRPSH